MTQELPEQLFRWIVESIPEAVVYSDRDGIIRLWNRGAEAIFGYRQEDALGHTLDLIIPEPWRARHWEGYRAVMLTGVTRYGHELLAVPASRSDGTRISIEFSIILPTDREGKVLATERMHRVAHRREIDDGRHPGEVLQKNTARPNGDLVPGLDGGSSRSDGLDLVGVIETERGDARHVLEEDSQGVGQAANIDAQANRVDRRDQQRPASYDQRDEGICHVFSFASARTEGAGQVCGTAARSMRTLPSSTPLVSSRAALVIATAGWALAPPR